MCGECVTSREHVPPKCLFPEKKDLPKGFNLRKNLITVPSCDLHNTHKSQDDQYLQLVLTCTFKGNNTKTNLFNTKVMRAFDRKPQLLAGFMKQREKVLVPDASGKLQETMKITVDPIRFNDVIKHMACGIVFHHYKEKWLRKNYKIISNVFLSEHDHANQAIFSAVETVGTAMSNIVSLGENEEVFRYQTISGNLGYFVQMTFYGEIKVSILLENV